MNITCKRTVLTSLEGVYCLEVFHTDDGLKIVAASELHGGECKVIDFQTRTEELVWDGPGGCMNVSQLNGRGDIVAVQNFYKGFQSRSARIVLASRDSAGSWRVKELASVPFAHRSGVVISENGPQVLISVLCTDRQSADDWSHPGNVQFLALSGDELRPAMLPGCERITKNHGFWQGKFDGEQVTLVSGSEGVFKICAKDGTWCTEKIIDREISDCAVADFDGDGEDELLLFEKFHGNSATINKRTNGEWMTVCWVEMDFSHAVWAGELLGQTMFAIGYRKGDGKLYLGGYSREQKEYFTQVLDTDVAPSNVRGFSCGGKDYLAVAARDMDQVLLYELGKCEEN